MEASFDHQIRPDPWWIGSARSSDVLEDGYANAKPWTQVSFLEQIIKNFSPERLSGAGGFGAVYRRVLKGECSIAVKPLERVEALQKELTSPHIERYPDDLKRISTDDNLCDSWIDRYKIIRGVCAGLHYLHTDNKILLEENPMPKISDFGLRGDYNSHPPMILAADSDIPESPCDVKFSVTASAKGGIDIKIGSLIVHVPKHLSAHHPLVQMVLFARHKFDDTFSCLKSMVPKSIFDMAKRSHHRAEHGIKGGKAKTSAVWVVATAAPHHATGNRDLLSGFVTEHDDQFVHALDGVPMPVRARGAVITDAVILPDVWFVPGLTANLVSVRQLADLGYSVGFTYGECCIRSAADGKTVGNAHFQESGGGLYVLDFLKIPLAI